jgi:hypothetical protein
MAGDMTFSRPIEGNAMTDRRAVETAGGGSHPGADLPPDARIADHDPLRHAYPPLHRSVHDEARRKAREGAFYVYLGLMLLAVGLIAILYHASPH